MLSFTACKKDSGSSLSDGDDNGGYASDASRIEWINNDVIQLAEVAGTVYNGIYMAPCATVATDTVTDPHTLIIRFGGTNCTCLDGRKRKGSIIISYSGRFLDTNKMHTITYDNYYVNDNQLTGSVKTIRVDTTITGNWFYKVYVNDSLNMSQDPKNSQFVVWMGNLVRKWTKGNVKNNLDRSDDVFSISGAATLTRPNGHTFSFGIATPLQFATSCDYAESGRVNVAGLNGGVRILNYGEGGCDPSAQLTIGVNNYNIALLK